MPLSEETPKTPWQARSVYLRVFVPLLLVILAVSAVRYHYMVESEVTAAHERAQAEATRVKPPRLMRWRWRRPCQCVAWRPP